MTDTSQTPYLEQPFPVYFLAGLLLLNAVALFQFDPLYIGAFLAFLYMIITPGFLILPFLTEKKLPPLLGIAFSVAISLFTLMITGLLVNTLLPLLGNHQPLTTVPLLITFDIVVYGLLMLNYAYKKNSPFEFHAFNGLSWIIAGLSFLLPICACLGAIILNNNGSDFLAMVLLVLAGALVPIVLLAHHEVSPSIPPLTLCLMALAFLLTNSMRSWFVTGHDILLEYHVFVLTNNAHLWSMALYQDPYTACLSLTILPTYIQSLIHVSSVYIFKFFTQFLGALPVVVVYFLIKEYTSEKIAFLAGFLYISFPTFMVDMAFLNRQGIAFIFFGALIFTLLTTEYFSGWKRNIALFLFGIGVIISHYSTSYIMIALLLRAYVLNRIIRWAVNAKKPQWLFRLTEKLGNKEMYQKPILLTLPLVLGLLALMVIWSSVITKTSTSFVNTLQQIITSVEHPFSFDEPTGPAKYGLIVGSQPTPTQLLNEFVQDGIRQAQADPDQSAFYPLSVTESYPATAVPEASAPITSFGHRLQSILHLNLTNFFNFIKQFYAKILQILLFIGLVGLMLGYGFKKRLLHHVPPEYLALSVAGLAVMIGQTVLPASAIDYGLLRLFQQNLIFLALPIILGFLSLSALITRNHTKQLAICSGILLFFYMILSGFFPQLTGGGRPPLPLDNSGLYYDSYYTHAQEVYSAEWLAQNGNLSLPVQAAHFSDMKMLAYGQIGAYIELLPETTKKDSYVYLNYDNVQTSNILEIVNGDVVYYHFPLQFLEANKNLIYNDGGSEIYR